MEERQENLLPVAVIGAGPVGLAAAAHLISRNLQPVIFEKGSGPAASIRSWSHVRVFSPWAYNMDHAAKTLLEETNWLPPNPDGLPTGAELLSDYLEPLANHPRIARAIHYNATVTSIGKKGFDKLTTAGRTEAPFLITWKNGKGQPGTVEASAVIDASGTWSSPNPMGTDGKPIEGEQESVDLIHYGIPDVLGRHKPDYENKTILVVGGGHSAINAVLELLKLQQTFPETKVIWSLRKNRLQKLFGGGLNDKLPARGELGNAAKRAIEKKMLTLLMPFVPQRVEKTESGLKVIGLYNFQTMETKVDRIIVATGFRPDIQIFRELRVSLDPVLEAPPALAPLIDPNIHSCGTVPPHGARELSHPETGFYVVGSKSYGRAPTFLMATGYEQVRSVVAEIAGDHEGAREVRLVLPETGVCSASRKESGGGSASKEAPVVITTPVLEAQTRPNIPESSGCCGGPSPTAGSCCVKDHEAKKSGKDGCGCGSGSTVVRIEPSVAIQSSCCA